jgi:hypothetical protein
LNIHFFNASQNGRAVLLCKERPTSLNSKPRVSAAAWTRWRISALVDPVLFKTRLAVATPQPALNATSLIVALIVAFWCKVSAVSRLVPAIGHLGDGGARGARYFGALSNPVSTLTVLMPISATA